MIDLGTKPTDGTTIQNAIVSGIWDDEDAGPAAGLKMHIYHNSVYIGGSSNNTYTNNLNSYAFRRELSSSNGYDSLEREE